MTCVPPNITTCTVELKDSKDKKKQKQKQKKQTNNKNTVWIAIDMAWTRFCFIFS